MGRPLDTYPARGLYLRDSDLENNFVLEGLLRDIHYGFLWYIHMGTPCGSWGPLSRSNRGSRTKERPQGQLVLERELLGNKQADLTALLARALLAEKAYYSIEDPFTSYLFLYEPIAALSRAGACYMIRFDQCA